MTVIKANFWNPFIQNLMTVFTLREKQCYWKHYPPTHVIYQLFTSMQNCWFEMKSIKKQLKSECGDSKLLSKIELQNVWWYCKRFHQQVHAFRGMFQELKRNYKLLKNIIKYYTYREVFCTKVLFSIVYWDYETDVIFSWKKSSYWIVVVEWMMSGMLRIILFSFLLKLACL